MQGVKQTLGETIDEFHQRAKDKSIVDYAFTPIISQYTDETYEEIPELIEAGQSDLQSVHVLRLEGQRL